MMLVAVLATGAATLAISDGIDGLTGLALAAGYGLIAGLVSALVASVFEWPPLD